MSVSLVSSVAWVIIFGRKSDTASTSKEGCIDIGKAVLICYCIDYTGATGVTHFTFSIKARVPLRLILN